MPFFEIPRQYYIICLVLCNINAVVYSVPARVYAYYNTQYAAVPAKVSYTEKNNEQILLRFWKIVFRPNVFVTRDDDEPFLFFLQFVPYEVHYFSAACHWLYCMSGGERRAEHLYNIYYGHVGITATRCRCFSFFFFFISIPKYVCNFFVVSGNSILLFECKKVNWNPTQLYQFLNNLKQKPMIVQKLDVCTRHVIRAYYSGDEV